MSLLGFLFSFNGRIRRLHLWLFILVMALIHGGLFWQFGHIVSMHHGSNYMMTANMPNTVSSFNFDGTSVVTHNPLAGIIGLVLVWIHLAVFIKRWHDRDKSGWWVLINLIPVVGFFWTLIECGFLDGTQGPNKYGPSPKGL